jgi:putative Holliday junction resolvase
VDIREILLPPGHFGYSSRVKYLGVDFGEKRIGLATSDASGLLATPRLSIRRQSDEAAIEAIAAFCREEEVEGIVLGLPRQRDGAESPVAPRVRAFARRLGLRLELPVAFVNEHLTTAEARQRFGSAADADAGAAAVILDEFLASAAR